MTFEDFDLTKYLRYAITDLGFEKPTPVQEEAFPVIRSGRNVVGISQTGTGKTFAFMLPILQDMKFSKQLHPRVLVIVPTRELVLQTVENIKSYAKYMSIRVIGVYGGTNINTQAIEVKKGVDIVVATPGRLYDLVLGGALKLKTVNKLVVDEVDVMLDLGFRFQLNNIYELLPERRQNIMFSATMTDEVEELIDAFFIDPAKISIAVSGTPLENIAQTCYSVENFYTKANLLAHLIKNKDEFSKALVFVSTKKNADRLYDYLESRFGKEMVVIHSNKSQNYRIRSIETFNTGKSRILLATDVIARGLDLDSISHVINIDVPDFPENYMHRIGRTGRAEKEGKSILFYTEREKEAKEQIELLMAYEIPALAFPEEVDVSEDLLPEEREKSNQKNPNRNAKDLSGGGAFHEKKDKNKKVNEPGKYRRELAKKYKKSQRRGDKIQNMKKKRK
jgi:ATP-dependent RNA helicase RhlE